MLLKRVFSFIIIAFSSISFANPNEYTFGVLAQQSAVLTASSWNPILSYVEKKSGVKLTLRTARTGDESKVATDKGEYDFVYSNHIFVTPQSVYKPILRPNSGDISGQIITPEGSPIKSLHDLARQSIGFPSKSAFIAYAVPMDYLKKQKIEFVEVFGANQEGIMAQLKSGNIVAASVNSKLAKAYASKENMSYRVLWESERFADIPIAAHARVPQTVINKVQETIANMTKDPEGMKILEEIAGATKQKPPYGFSKATMQNYQGYIDFYKHRVK
jgi:phosphonate transport system substrate-binding protein